MDLYKAFLFASVVAELLHKITKETLQMEETTETVAADTFCEKSENLFSA